MKKPDEDATGVAVAGLAAAYKRIPEDAGGALIVLYLSRDGGFGMSSWCGNREPPKDLVTAMLKGALEVVQGGTIVMAMVGDQIVQRPKGGV